MFPEAADLVLHVEASVPEGVAEDVGEQFHGRYALELCDGAYPEKSGNTEGCEEELDGARNVLFIRWIRWYNRT